MIKINVGGHEVTESESERLLGLIINNTLTWKDHLYGNGENKGLIPKLSQRAGIIRKLSFIMPMDRLNMIAEGIFFSLLNYGVEVYGNVWGLQSYDEETRLSTAFRKEDNRKLQVLVNKVLRSLTGSDRYTSSSVLSSTSGKLSVHQRTAFFSINSVHRTLQTKEPAYSYSLFKPNEMQVENCNPVNYNLSISRCSYHYRACRLYNQLPVSLTQSSNQSVFKTGAKQWVLQNIPLQPP